MHRNTYMTKRTITTTIQSYTPLSPNVDIVIVAELVQNRLEVVEPERGFGSSPPSAMVRSSYNSGTQRQSKGSNVKVNLYMSYENLILA